MNKSKQLKEWLHKNDFTDITVRKCDCFCYSFSEECIYWTNEGTEHDHIYLKFIKHLGFNSKLDMRAISFLHELGHHELDDEYTTFDFLVDRLFRDKLEVECANKFMLWLRANLYYRLPLEYKATKWMIQFIKYFNKEAEELSNIFVEGV